ncbi:MAG: hypothetical protein ABIW34_03380, partial [Ginsengibacter sp.]
MRLNFPEKETLQNRLALFMYAFFVFALIFATKTVYSGFHLSDDQILIGFRTQTDHRSFFSSAINAIKDDLYLRFRPLAILYYMALAKWLYPNFFLIAATVALQGIFACYFLYRFARLLQCAFVASFLFPLFILCGNQGVIFWRNCVNETFGMLLLSLSLFFMGKLFKAKLSYNRNLVFFSIFLLLSTLAKESFIILVPAIIFFKIWQDFLQADTTFLRAVKANIKLVAFFAVITIAEILIIYHYKAISNHFIEYVAIDKDTFNTSNLFISFYRLVITKGYLLIIAPALISILSKRQQLYTWRKDVKKFFLPLCIIFLLITIPQVVLYAKSLIFERYLLPGTLGCAVVIIFFTKYIHQHNKQLTLLCNTFLLTCGLLLCVQIFLMIKAAPVYAAAGFEARAVLDTIVQNTNTNDTILLVAFAEGQSDKAISVKAYLNAPIGGNRKNIFIEPIIDSTV